MSLVMSAVTALNPTVGKVLKKVVGPVGAILEVTDATVKGIQKIAGYYQAIDDTHYIKGLLSNILIFSAKGAYGADYAFYWPDHFGAAMAIMSSNDSGDLYLLQLTGQELSNCRYDRVLVFAKFGLSSNISSSKVVVELAKLPKRSGAVSGSGLNISFALY